MELIELLKIAKVFKGNPAELQDLLKKKCEKVISVGDDLSFVIKLDEDIVIEEKELKALGGRKRKIYPFKFAYQFERGYIAWSGRFIRISREIDEKLLEKILSSLDSSKD